MGEAVHKRIPAKHSLSPRHRIIGLFVVLLLVLLALPAAVSATAGHAGTSARSVGLSLQSVEASGIIAAPSAVPFTVQPTPDPVRENRTSLIQIAKKAAERPKVSVPSGLFLLIVAIAIIGLLAILYLLIRRTAGSFRGKKKPEKPALRVIQRLSKKLPHRQRKQPAGTRVPRSRSPRRWKNGSFTRNLSAKEGLPGSSGHRISRRA